MGFGPLRSPGIFVRDTADLDPAVARDCGIEWVCVAVTSRERAINRGRAWYARALLEGLRLRTFTWFTTHEGVTRRAARFSAEVGAEALILNNEKEARGWHPRTAMRLEASARGSDLRVGLVSYSIPRSVRDFPWRGFTPSIAMPEIYDRLGKYDPAYPGRAIRGWAAQYPNAEIVPACGLHVLERGKPRYRTQEEIERHLSLFPAPGPHGPYKALSRDICAWPLGTSGTLPTDVLRAYTAAARGVCLALET